MIWAIWALWLGCATETTVCQDVCDELVFTCSYEAYPTFDSCLQGCEYDAEQGADIEAKRTCVQAAACDTFAIVECEH